MDARRNLEDLALAVGADPGVPIPCRWPAIPAEYEAAATAISMAIRRRRPTAPSVAHEERLDADVDTVLEIALTRDGLAGVGGDLARRAGFDPEVRDELRWAARARASHLWPMSMLLDYGIEDLICLAHDRWMARYDGRTYEFVEGSPFANADAVIDLFRDVVQLVGVTGDRRLNDASPVCESTLGSVGRLTVAIKPAVSGISPVRAAFRLPARAGLRSLDDYVRRGVMNEAAAEVLRAAVVGRVNILIAGPASAGKTTLMRVLCGMVPESEIVVVVEDGSELQLDADRGDGRQWVHSVIPLSTVEDQSGDETAPRVSLMDQVRHALRFNPQRIILGEARGEEMAVVAKALMTGHAGSMTTIHAESAEEAIDQAAMYIREDARFSHSETLARAMAARAIHLVVHLAPAEGRRVMTGMIGVDPSGGVEPLFERTDEGEYKDTVSAALTKIPRLKRRIGAVRPAARTPVRARQARGA